MGNSSWLYKPVYGPDLPYGTTYNAEDAIGWMTSSDEHKNT